MDIPPTPVQWKTSTSYPSSSKRARAASTAGVVTPNIVAATTGLSGAESGGVAVTMPAIAAAAFERIGRETELIPATSTTEYIRAMSLPPR
jgi:hypothetical protein